MAWQGLPRWDGYVLHDVTNDLIHADSIPAEQLEHIRL